MSGLVKVGRTARDPAGRADELSRATGVPTEFILAFRRYFSDSETAERFVHTFLERRGYRVSANREFFRAPLEEVVDAVLQAPGGTSEVEKDSTEDEAPAAHQPDESQDALAVHDHPVWESVFEEAQEHYLGPGTVLQDYREALKLYEQAARLGATKAYLCLGKMYRLGEGCTQSNRKALENLKEGARLGDVNCYVEMAEWFVEEGQMENAQKCWERYFASPPHDTVGFCGFRYFAICKMYNWDVSHVPELSEHFSQILLAALNVCSIARRDHDTARSAHPPLIISELSPSGPEGGGSVAPR